MNKHPTSYRLGNKTSHFVLCWKRKLDHALTRSMDANRRRVGRRRGHSTHNKRVKLDYARFNFGDEQAKENSSSSNESPEVKERKETPPSIMHLLLKRQRCGQPISSASFRQKPRTLKFRELGTSPTEAVLGLNATGDHLVSLNSSHESFSLCIYSLPSPGTKNRAVRLTRSIPLEDSYRYDPTSDSAALDMFAPPPVRVPVRIWWSADSRLSACLYRTGADGLATALVLSLRDFNYYWKMPNISIPSAVQWDASPCDAANLFWSVDVIPSAKTHMTRVSCYLYLVDEGDGFRATWFCPQGWRWDKLPRDPAHACWSRPRLPAQKRKYVVRANEESRIVVPLSWADAGWEYCSPDTTENTEVGIPFCAFFSTSVLLHSILKLTPKVVSPTFDANSPCLPNYAHHIVSTKAGGRILEVLLVFSVGPVGKGCVGVLADVDLATQDFFVLRWHRLTGVDTPPSNCGKLANHRRRELLGDDSALLYPDCVTIDNRAVRHERPVYALAARDAPVRIVYQ